MLLVFLRALLEGNAFTWMLKKKKEKESCLFLGTEQCPYDDFSTFTFYGVSGRQMLLRTSRVAGIYYFW